MSNFEPADLLFNQPAKTRAVLNALVRAMLLDVGAIARERDPMRCRPDNLVFQFFEHGGTWWNDAWPEAKRRAYVRDLLVYKRLEGTPLGVELYANLEGAVVLAEELPPDRAAVVSEPHLDRDAVLALMPQLRLYHRWPAAYVNRAVGFVGVGAVGLSAVTVDRARALGRYPAVFDPATGVETPLAIGGVGLGASAVTLSYDGTRAHAPAVGWSGIGQIAMAPANRPAPLVVDLADPGFSVVTVPPPAYRQQLVPGRRAVGQSAVMAVDPDAGSYDRLYLLDTSRIPPRAGVAGPAFAVGVSRLGLPAYHQVLHVSVPGFLPALPPRGRSVGGLAVLARQPDRPLAQAMRAVECARRPGDRLLVTLEPRRPGARPAPVPSISELAA